MAIIGEIRKRSGLAVGVVFIALAAFVITDFVKRGVEQPELGEIDGKEIKKIIGFRSAFCEKIGTKQTFFTPKHSLPSTIIFKIHPIFIC